MCNVVSFGQKDESTDRKMDGPMNWQMDWQEGQTDVWMDAETYSYSMKMC